MSITERDRKILLLLVPVLLLGAYWFLLLSPKREQASAAAQELAVQEQRRDDAQARAAALDGARTDFAADYAELVRIGKAVPPAVDMPTLLVQLEDAAHGTDIDFKRITAQEREAATPAARPPGSDAGDPAAAGGEPAQSGPGTAAETAGNAVTGANADSAAAEQSGVDPADAQTSQAAKDGSLPVGGGSAPTGSEPSGSSSVAGLDSVGIEVELTGDFLDLADFFHRVKRYVEVDERRLAVRGRLLTVDGIAFESEPDIFPRVRATLTATAYLAPRSEGVTAGATPSGPAPIPAATADAGVPLASTTPTAAP